MTFDAWLTLAILAATFATLVATKLPPVTVFLGALTLCITFGLAPIERFMLQTVAPLPPGSRSSSQSESYWDGIIGLRGNVNFTENWYLPFHLDVGAGDSDFTWQAMAGIGYHFSWGDIVGGYRYLEWEFDDQAIAANLDYSGPLAGIRFQF